MIESGGTVTLLRNEPVQARSTARLTSLLDAAAAVVHKLGYERLTTAMVAERAGSSIGTIYRYFPDRIAVLQALSARSLAVFASEGIERVEAGSSWQDAVGAALDYLVDAFRSEPGFRSLRFGDVLDLRPNRDGRTNYGVVASAIVSVLSSRHRMDDSDQIRFDVESALLVADALLTRAFALDGEPDERYVEEARRVALNCLTEKHGG